MTGPRYGPFDAWNPALSEPEPLAARWRPGRLGLVAAAGVALLVLIAGWAVATRRDPSGVELADPSAVAALFVQRYATHDPAVCELVTSALRVRLDGEGRCAGPTRGVSPSLAVISSQTCGTTHEFTAAVAPAGEVGKRFVSVDLELTGTAWLVRSVLPIEDCRVLQPPTCDGQ